MMAYEYINTTDTETAADFLTFCNIPYRIMKSGINRGRIQAKRCLAADRHRLEDILQKMRQSYPDFCEHMNAFRDDDDNMIVTFSPYETPGVLDFTEDGRWTFTPYDLTLPGYSCKVLTKSVYGMDTQTIVIRQTVKGSRRPEYT